MSNIPNYAKSWTPENLQAYIEGPGYGPSHFFTVFFGWWLWRDGEESNYPDEKKRERMLVRAVHELRQEGIQHSSSTGGRFDWGSFSTDKCMLMRVEHTLLSRYASDFQPAYIKNNKPKPDWYLDGMLRSERLESVEYKFDPVTLLFVMYACHSRLSTVRDVIISLRGDLEEKAVDDNPQITPRAQADAHTNPTSTEVSSSQAHDNFQSSSLSLSTSNNLTPPSTSSADQNATVFAPRQPATKPPIQDLIINIAYVRRASSSSPIEISNRLVPVGHIVPGGTAARGSLCLDAMTLFSHGGPTPLRIFCFRNSSQALWEISRSDQPGFAGVVQDLYAQMDTQQTTNVDIFVADSAEILSQLPMTHRVPSSFKEQHISIAVPET